MTFERHPQLVVLTTVDNGPHEWLRAGQALQRTLLTATDPGIATTLLTQPLDARDLDHPDPLADRDGRRHVQAIVRIGYGPRPPRSLRPPPPGPHPHHREDHAPPRKRPPPCSPDHAEIVRAPLPAVAAHGTEITGRFYPSMFAAHPELRDLFNQGNQANGEQRRALAGSVAAFAAQLCGLDIPVSQQRTLSRIAHKHASFSVRPEQYTIVGRHLLEAVADVLGEAVTPEIHAAWSKVYWLFATLLVAEEARLHQRAHLDPAGLYRPWRVTGRRDEADDVVAFVLEPGGVPAFLPGQHVSVAVKLPGGLRQPRQYTLSRAVGGRGLQITVRRVRGQDGSPDGWSWSPPALASPPPPRCWTTWPPPSPTARSPSCTPTAPPAPTRCTPGRPPPGGCRNCARSPGTRTLARSPTRTCFRAVPTSARCRSPLPAKAQVHLCGPISFMRDVRRGLLGEGAARSASTTRSSAPTCGSRPTDPGTAPYRSSTTEPARPGRRPGRDQPHQGGR
ncbi:globin domain-containing protein [Actinomadura namibiensis]|uniref:nitric oxide dioxygenase n=1 Tax=Actinomadura namibiensis TaxID=182080 RepID=A0A7W3QNJ1_ACTNM|nr:globin domain-containing protein [Actinomadura namibiensis]MBA8953083.1 hemoglobin-like flavoprotein [Actinomadura namibiensis]